MTPPADDDHHELADEIRTALRSAMPPGWRVIREIGLRVPGGNAIPDITVLRPGAPRRVMWHESADVALVVEVESPSSSRHDRFTELGLYAEAGIDSDRAGTCRAPLPAGRRRPLRPAPVGPTRRGGTRRVAVSGAGGAGPLAGLTVSRSGRRGWRAGPDR